MGQKWNTSVRINFSRSRNKKKKWSIHFFQIFFVFGHFLPFSLLRFLFNFRAFFQFSNVFSKSKNTIFEAATLAGRYYSGNQWYRMFHLNINFLILPIGVLMLKIRVTVYLLMMGTIYSLFLSFTKKIPIEYRFYKPHFSCIDHYYP